MNRQCVAGLAIVAFVFLAAILAPWLAPHDPLQQHLLRRREGPSLAHPFGLDELGRDNLSRVLYGALPSLRAGVGAVFLALVVGALVGGVAGYVGGWLDAAIIACLDAIAAFPSLLLSIAFVAVIGRGMAPATYAVALTFIPTYARLLRVGVLRAKGQGYVLAARAVGASPGRVLWRHILPNCPGPLLAQATLGVGSAILEIASLGFLGLGAQPPAAEWGAMIGQGRGAVFAAPHIPFFPGLALTITVIGFGLLGNGLFDFLDPSRASR